MPFIPYSIRDKHIHVIGKTGHGKSTLLAWAAYNDIECNEGGVCVIDPKGGVGDLADIVCRHIPDDRIDDCIWLDLDNPIPLDFMACEPGQEEMVVNDLKYILTKGMVDTGSSPTLSANIENLLYTLLNANLNPEMPCESRCTFLDIHNFFRNAERQRFILRYVTNPDLRREWTTDNFPKPPDVARIITRINPFVRSSTLSAIFGESNPRLNIAEVVNGKKILLVSIPVRNPSSMTYGALLISKIQAAVFSRHHIPERDRIPFFLYVDEFQNFRASEEFDKMLTMARSYRLCLTLANLRIGELEEQVRSALGIISTYILFRISPQDESFYASIIGRHDPYAELRAKAERLELEARLTMEPTFSQTMKWGLDQANREIRGLPYDDPALWHKLDKMQISSEARRIYEYLDSVPPVVTVKDALALPEYKAIYKIGSEPAVIEDSPTPPSKNPTEAQAAKVEYIKRNSLRLYGSRQSRNAQFDSNRPGDKASSNSVQVLHDEGDGILNTNRQSREPQAARRILPPDKNKAGGSRNRR